MSEHIGLEGWFEWNLVAFDLYLYSYYTLAVSLLYLFLKCKIKIAPVEFYIRCLFICIVCQYRVSLPTKLILPFIYSAIA